ncbi:MAG: class I SAM-dependent methyltransferase [Nitrospiria bacterium]
MTNRSEGIYRSQRLYFQHAYETGRHGWPTEGISRMVAQFLQVHGGTGRSALDIGCGEGRHTAAFADAGYRAIGLDLERGALAKARAGGGKACRRARWVQADVFALPFGAASFDVVIDYGCLHHIRRRDTGRYLEQVVPLLSPDGHYLLSCFSTQFKHHPGERRHRNWLVHRGHYDRFFRRSDFPSIFGRWFEVVEITEDRDGSYVFFNVMMRKRAIPAPEARRPARGRVAGRADAGYRVR